MRRSRRPSSDSVTTPVRHRPSLDFSLTGLIYVCMMLFMGLAAINSQVNLLFGVFGLMIGVLLVSGVISRFVLRKLTIKRILPEHAIVGQPMNVSYEFTNAKKYWPSLSVTVAEIDGVEAFAKQPHGYLLHAAPKVAVTVPVELIPKRRGLHTLDRHQISTSFPFGFIKRAMDRRIEDRLLIYPAVGVVDPKLMELMRSAENSGPTMRPRRGGADEFYGLKEFRVGENARYIYWRRSARTGTLVAKEMTHVSPPRLLLLVDTHSPPGNARRSDEQAGIEKTISMAASLINHAIEQGLPVGLVCWSSEWVGVSPNRGKRHRRDLLTILARLPVNADHTTMELIDASFAFQDSTTTSVLLTPRDVQLGLGDSARGGTVVISAANPQTNTWFKFDRAVDFARCAPPEQMREIDKVTR